MTRLLRNLLIGGFLLSFVVMLGFFNATKPRILVLHSGAQESDWVAAVDRGMRSALQTNRRPLSVEWDYMAVAAPAAARNPAAAVAEARRAVDRFKPDVVIAVDDEANALVARDYVGRDRPRILYVSIDRPPDFYGYAGAPNVSGIAEKLPWNAIRDGLEVLFAGRPVTLAALGVDGATDQATLAQLKAFDWGPASLGPTALVSTADAWRDHVQRAAAADVLVLLSTQDLPDRDGRVSTAAELIAWTQANARPLPIGTDAGFVAAGGGLSFSPPPDDEGERAIRLALDWLDDRTSPGPPPPVESSHFEVAVRQDALNRRGLALPPIYLEAARENGTLF
ncbi:MAG: hypothetical protein FGM52_10075 [Mycobacterium sp.]|nr:hypothetical protein [Mycobacterium sp.]